MVVLGMVFPAPKPITLERASSMTGCGAVKIVGAYPRHWRASTRPTGYSKPGRVRSSLGRNAPKPQSYMSDFIYSADFRASRHENRLE